MVESLLKKRFGHKYEFISAGISPISQPNMDPRSLEFLKKNQAIYNFHTPKKVNKRMLDYFDKFLAVDFYVLNQLNLLYPKYKHKFFNLTAHFSDLSIIDPYKFEADEYAKVMSDIMLVAKKIDLEEF